MASYKAKAIILKSYKLGEADKIIKLFSSDGYLISAVAKGARKVRSRFGGRLELFNLVDIEAAEGRNLDVLNQVEILQSFKNIPQDFNKFIFCELIGNIILKTQAPEGDPSPLLFKLLYFCFNEIDNIEQDDVETIKKTMSFFIAKFLKISGYAPLMESCSSCGAPVSGLYSFHKNNIPFSVGYGGILCKKCALSIAVKDSLNPSGYRLLSDLLDLKLEEIRDMQANPYDLKKIYRLLESYLVYHTGCTVESFKYLKKIGL
ncbi:MAG: DNA repair protein RecO [Actinobacteria bacterium]|nr:DNA repair protein RecO [Actinomycetota bacterium]